MAPSSKVEVGGDRSRSGPGAAPTGHGPGRAPLRRETSLRASYIKPFPSVVKTRLRNDDGQVANGGTAALG